MSVLEKVADPADVISGKRKAEDFDPEDLTVKKKKDADDDKAKSKPVALVPPRMQNASGSASPSVHQQSKRGRPKRKSKDIQSSADGSSKSEHGPRPPHHKYSFPGDLPMPFHSDMPQYPLHHLVQNAYSVRHSSPPCYPESLYRAGGHTSTPVHGEECRDPLGPRSDPHDYYLNHMYHDHYPRCHTFFDATRSLLQMNENGNTPVPKHILLTGSSPQNPNNSDMLNSSFPPHVSTTTPFWQQYANLARTVVGRDGVGSGNDSSTVAKRHSSGSTTDTASNSSQELSLNSPAAAKAQTPSPVQSSAVLKPDKNMPLNREYSPDNTYVRNSNSNKLGVKAMQNSLTLPNQASHQMKPANSSKFNTKHFITQSAIASFPHLSKTGSLQNHSVSSLLSSQQSILEKAALKSSEGPGMSSQGPKDVPSHASNLSVPNKRDLHQQTSSQELKSKSATTQSFVTSNSETLKQLGRQLSLHSGKSQTKILLSELTLPVKSTVFSSPLMTYHQMKSTVNPNSTASSEAKKLGASTQRPNSSATFSVAGNSHVTGVVKLGDATDAYSRSACIESWSSAGLSAKLPPKFKAATFDGSKVQSSMTIYKPGSASGVKSGRKGKNANKVTKSASIDLKKVKQSDESKDSAVKTVCLTSTAYAPIIPNPGARVVYQNPIMTILPTHSRLLVVPNVTSVTTNSSSFSTVFYINSQNSNQKAQHPVVASNLITSNQSASNLVVTNPLSANSVVSSPLVTKPVATNPAVTNPAVARPVMSSRDNSGIGTIASIASENNSSLSDAVTRSFQHVPAETAQQLVTAISSAEKSHRGPSAP